MRLAAVSAMDEVLGLAPGAEIETMDGTTFRVEAVTAWAPSWARLTLNRTA
ncbi:hypothetical protein SAMN02799631_03223 [Methylobacterium sp. 174MFSha1.1]|nr:hypothetical protein SAMN02799631_03223 [Methylobacterium sp. 174MFSha1.1]